MTTVLPRLRKIIDTTVKSSRLLPPQNNIETFIMVPNRRVISSVVSTMCTMLYISAAQISPCFLVQEEFVRFRLNDSMIVLNDGYPTNVCISPRTFESGNLSLRQILLFAHELGDLLFVRFHASGEMLLDTYILTLHRVQVFLNLYVVESQLSQRGVLTKEDDLVDLVLYASREDILILSDSAEGVAAEIEKPRTFSNLVLAPPGSAVVKNYQRLAVAWMRRVESLLPLQVSRRARDQIFVPK
jgi:hypothetical protein